MKTSLKLLNQMIEVAEADDLESRKANLKKGGTLMVGENWMVFHLKLLKELLNQEKGG